MGRSKDIAGLKFGRLTVLERDGRDSHGRAMWSCVCDCGVVKTVGGYKLQASHTRSCGCLQRELATTHGMSGDRLYGTWKSMIQRCEHPSSDNYCYYGGRGIKVCKRWHSVEKFVADMGPSYEPGLTLDRIDSDGNYTPENCQWSTPTAQGRNKRNNRLITINGKTHCVAEWAEVLGVNKYVIRRRCPAKQED